MAAALLLAFAAGTVDAVGYLALHRLFTANMTGNTTKLAIAGSHGGVEKVVPIAVAVGTFVGAIGLTTGAIEVARRSGVRSASAHALVVEAALLSALMVGGARVLHHGTTPDHASGGFYLLLTLAVTAMGIQTAGFARALGSTVRTTYVSGLITTFAEELVNVLMPPRDGAPSYLRDELGLGGRRQSAARMLLHLGVWASFVAGASWGAYGEPRWSTWTLALAVGPVIATAAIDARGA